ncbi:hypothetical protein NUW58_g106 [Xylaria curta]|uniref:Uncharacterized protein n=1 Tax=Xylaria curta TaxID=42375 RepID=A0ACC1PRL3_9PEZI|nr:hypothetical protein NUW58_g106 [Xylaria curta]
MPSGPRNGRNYGPAVSISSQLPLEPALRTSTKRRQGLLYGEGEEAEILGYRSSSVKTNSSAIQRGSGSNTSPTTNYDLDSDSDLDHQASTQPVPADSDASGHSRSSSGLLLPCRDGPITRARAREQELHIHDQTRGNNPGVSSHKNNKPSSKTNNDNHQFPPLLSHQNSSSSRADKPKTKFIDGYDGSVDEHSIADGESLVSLVFTSESSKSNPDDDEYELPKSEIDGSCSEMSIIAEIRGHRKNTPNHKSTKVAYSSKPRGKQIAKGKAAPIVTKKSNLSGTNKTTTPVQEVPVVLIHAVHSPSEQDASLDEPVPIPQDANIIPECSSQENSGLAQNHQDFVKDSQDTASPLKSRLPTSKPRRAKRPFSQDNRGSQETKQVLAASTHGINDIYRKSTAREGKSSSTSPINTAIRVDREAQAITPAKLTTLNTRYAEAKRQKGNSGVRLAAGKRTDRVTIYKRPTIHEANSSPISQSANHHSQFTDREYGGTHLQNSDSYYTGDGTSQILDNLKPSERLANESELNIFNEEAPDNFDVHTQAHVLHSDSSPIRLNHMKDVENGAIQAISIDTQPWSRHPYHQVELEEEVARDDTTRSCFVVTGETSHVKHIPTKVAGECKETGHKSSTKTFGGTSNAKQPLHPNSIKWAKGLANISRQGGLTSVPAAIVEEREPLVQTPATMRESALRGQRDAIFESIQDLTTTALKHLQSKESVVDNITENYQRSGRKLIDMVMDRQYTELRHVSADFHRKCIQLRNLFRESAHHLRTIHREVPSKDNQYLRDWDKRSKELEEEIKVAKKALAYMTENIP